MRFLNTIRLLGLGVAFALVVVPGSAIAAADPAKKACIKDARALCPNEMKSLSRKKVEACMVKNVERVSPSCKEAMYEVKRIRESKKKS